MNNVNTELLNRHKSQPIEESKKEINNISLALKSQRDVFMELASREFDVEKWTGKFYIFVSSYKKLFYSVISSIILKELDENQTSLILSNLSNVIDLKKQSANEEQYKFLLKLFDHCSLAATQKNVYQKTKQDIEKETSEIFNGLQKDMTGQLIGLISIFTALAFLVFGSISILDNLLTNVQSQPLLKVLFVADLWLLCMTNMFMIFARVIGKFTKIKIEFSLYFWILNIVLVLYLIFALFPIKTIEKFFQ